MKRYTKLSQIAELWYVRLVRRARRYGLNAPRRGWFWALMVSGVLILLVVGWAAGWLGSRILDEAQVRSTLVACGLAGVVAAYTIVGRLGAVTIALRSPPLWNPVAATSVSPRLFVYGWILAPQIAKTVVIGSVLAAVMVSMAPDEPGLSATSMLAVLILGGLRVCLMMVEGLLIDRGRLLRVVQIMVSVTPLVVVVLAWPVIGAHIGMPSWILSTVAVVVHQHAAFIIVAETALLAGVSLVATWVHKRLGRLTFGDITDAQLGRRITYRDESVLPRSRRSAVLVSDLRRVMRPPRERLMEFAYAGGAAVVIGGPLVVIVAMGKVNLPASLMGPESYLMACCGVCLFALLGAQALITMDADKHALVLWQTIPGALRVVASARAMLSTSILYVVGVAAAVLIRSWFAVDPAQLVAAVAVVAVFAVSASLAEVGFSLKWPSFHWADVSEIGSGRVWRRFSLGVIVPVVMGTIWVARRWRLDAGFVTDVVVVVLIGVVSVYSASLLMGLLARLIGGSVVVRY